MATGYWIVKGDKTSCGGTVLEGTRKKTFAGNYAALNGHKVSCGKHPGVFHVAGGHPGDIVDTVYVASTLYSRSTCPCRARFIPSQTWAWHGPHHNPPVKAAPVAAKDAPDPAQEPEQHTQAAKKERQEQTKPQKSKREPVDAGFCVIPYGAETRAYEPWLFESEPPAGARELYRLLNGAGQEYKAGSILLLVDPDKQQSEQIEHMQKAKARVDAALEPLTHEEANFLHNHYATIANFSNIADKGIGLAAEPVEKYFEGIEKILKEIQETYKNTYLTRGALIGEQFYIRRAQLFKELETLLKVGFLNKAMKLGQYNKIKNALGLSTSSITHRWNETGISDIEGYATHIERAAKYVKAMRYTGYLGIGFSGLHSLNEIHEACSVGREAECTKKKYTEIGSFALGTGGGVLAGSGAIPLCVAIGVGTAGVGGLVCTVIAGVGLGYAGSTVGSAVGELGGEQLYDVFGN